MIGNPFTWRNLWNGLLPWKPRGGGMFVCLILMGVALSGAGEQPRAKAPGDDLFAHALIPRLRIEISPQGMAVLRSYEWDRSLNGQDRTNVLATVREGDEVYTNVAIHL